MDEALTEDQSHYEISLTAGQAFAAFVLMLLSLAASFAFGLMIGRGQADDRLVMRKDAAVVSEAAVIPKKAPAKIAEQPVKEDDFKPAPAPTISEASVEAGLSPPPRAHCHRGGTTRGAPHAARFDHAHQIGRQTSPDQQRDADNPARQC